MVSENWCGKQHVFGVGKKSHNYSVRSSVRKKVSVVMRKLKITFVVCIIFLLDSADPERYLHILAKKTTMLYNEILKKKKRAANMHICTCTSW